MTSSPRRNQVVRSMLGTLLPVGLLVALGAAAGLAIADGPLGSAASTARFPPGRLVDVGGFSLHMRCEGTGPTVVIETGLGDQMASWTAVLSAAARDARVCLYDRAGAGWSDDDTEPPTLDRMVRNLHAALQHAEGPGPYVLVGHAQGGLVVRGFQAAHPDEVDALVLIESTHENQIALLPHAVSDLGTSEWLGHRVCQADASLALVRASGLINAYVPVQGLENLRPLHADAVLDTRFCATVREEARAFTLAASQTDRPPSVGDLPLFVLTAARGIAEDPSLIDLPLSTEDIRRWDASWMALQASLAKLSTAGEHRVIDATSHFVQVDRPDAVVEAIRDAVEAGQGRRASAPGSR